jgi:hypothetical protein
MYRVDVYVNNGVDAPRKFTDIDLNTPNGPVQVTAKTGGKIGELANQLALLGPDKLLILYAPNYTQNAARALMAQYGSRVIVAMNQTGLEEAEQLRAFVQHTEPEAGG